MVKPFEQEDAVRIRGARIRTASALAVQGEEQGTTASAKGKLRYAIKGTDRAAG